MKRLISVFIFFMSHLALAGGNSTAYEAAAEGAAAEDEKSEAAAAGEVLEWPLQFAFLEADEADDSLTARVHEECLDFMSAVYGNSSVSEGEDVTEALLGSAGAAAQLPSLDEDFFALFSGSNDALLPVLEEGRGMPQNVSETTGQERRRRRTERSSEKARKYRDRKKVYVQNLETSIREKEGTIRRQKEKLEELKRKIKELTERCRFFESLSTNQAAVFLPHSSK